MTARRANAARLTAASVVPIVALAAVLMCYAHFSTIEAARAAGTTRYVSNDGGSDAANDCATSASPCKTIQRAVDQSAAGDAVLVAGGVYTGVMNHGAIAFIVYVSMTLRLQGGYTTTDAFALSDPAANPTILDAEQGGINIFFGGADGDFSNLTVQNGNNSGDGGGIFAYPSNGLTLTHVSVLSNTADFGGGISVHGRVVMRDLTVLNNSAVEGGGGAWVQTGPFLPSAILDGGVFQNNSVIRTQGVGGGIEVRGNLTIAGTQFLSNTVMSGGGGGGGVYVLNGVLTLTHAFFEANIAFGGYGGGAYSNGDLVMSDTTFIGNVAHSGAGAAVASAATIQGGLFQNNNSIDEVGGGLLLGGDTDLTGTQFLSNTAGTQGGGLYAGKTLVMTGTRFVGNTAPQGGGAYLNHYNSISVDRVVNALFARNAAGSGLGAALFLNSPGQVQILFSTIASPTVSEGSAIQIATGTVGITDTIIASHTVAISQTGGTVYEDYNLLFGNSSPLSGTVTRGGHDQSGNPLFNAPFADDYHLLPGSAAIDTGVNSGAASDLDGNARPRGLGYDIGAYEAPFTGTVVFLPWVAR